MTNISTSKLPGEPPEALVMALIRLFRPLVRLLLSYRVTYTYLANLLKSVYVDVAERDFPVDGKRQTDSRISLLTAVHRKDVKRLRRERTLDDATPSTVSLGAQLVGRWTGLPKYLDEHGHPRPLPRLAGGENGKSFEGLVQSVSKDIRPRAVLDEWLRLGVAHMDDQDHVWLNVAAFIPERGFEEKAFYFGRNLRDHIAAGAHNLLGLSPPFVERSVYYDGLTPESVQELAELSEELGMKALHAVNRRAMELQNRDKDDPKANFRMNFGIYNFSAEDTEQDTPDAGYV